VTSVRPTWTIHFARPSAVIFEAAPVGGRGGPIDQEDDRT
jgi:hypothetical protein